MPSVAGLAFLPWAALVAAVGARSLPGRNWRSTDSGELDLVRCPDDRSHPITVGCPVKLTEPDYALNFVCPYFDLYEECMWYIDRRPMGRTHPKDYRGHGPLSVMPDAANGHTAVVSNFNAEQSDLMLQLAVQGPGEDLSLEGTEVKCSCQPRGEPGPTREAKTVIADKRVKE